MAPSRPAVASDPSSSQQPSSVNQKKSKRPQHKKHPAPAPNTSSALPGVQKIKAALRQTRRLLAKDKLAADVRVATERRLKSLEGDLAQAEQARLERTMATRYHKIKFFERQKVVRKLAQTKKRLAEATEKKERKKLETRLAGLRVDLSYILHYPKARKYVSLFPPEVRKGEDGEVRAGKEAEGKAETDRQREQIRKWVREQMDAGVLSWEPEEQMGRLDGKGADTGGFSGFTTDRTQAKDRKTKTAGENGKSKSSSKSTKGDGVADDEFFAMEEEEEDLESVGDEDDGGSGEDSSGDNGMDED